MKKRVFYIIELNNLPLTHNLGMWQNISFYFQKFIQKDV